MSRLRPLSTLAAALLFSCGGDPAPANPCATNPCLNGGTCSASGSVASCACAAAFTGPLCATPATNACAPNPCQNGGTCSTSGSAALCACTSGFLGATCSQHTAAVTAVTPPGTVASGTPATFTATISDPDSLITSVAWVFGDGGTFSDTAGTRQSGVLTSTATHTYAAGGTQSVSVTVTGGGATAIKSTTVTVSGPLPTCATTSYTVTAPGFEYDFSGVTGANPPITVCRGQKFTFQGQDISSVHPFCIWNENNQSNAPGVSGGDASHCISGNEVMTWDVPANLTTGARYICNIHFFGNVFVIK